MFRDSHLKSENLTPTTSTCPDCLLVREQNMFLEANDLHSYELFFFYLFLLLFV